MCVRTLLLLHAAGQLVAQVVAAVGGLKLLCDHIKLTSELRDKQQTVSKQQAANNKHSLTT